MKTFYYILILAFVVFITLAILPVDNSKGNCVKVKGTVKNISEGGVKDLVIQIKNDPVSYYINRGLENGFTLSQAKKDFIGKKITFFYTKSWTPFAPFGSISKQITEVAVDDVILYTEWE